MHIPCLCPLWFVCYGFSRWRWIYLCAHGIDLLGPAGDNPHVIGTGIEKRSETLCHQFLLKSHLDIFLLYTLTIFYFFFFHINCALVYINFLCLFALLFSTTNITLCIYLNNNIFIFYTWTCLLYKIN